MSNLVYTSSAPGSMMLMGEHAVLHHQPALSIAIDARMYIKLTPRTDSHIGIYSALGEYHTDLEDCTPTTPFQFVLATFDHALTHFSHPSTGCDIHIHSDFRPDLGLGSSAAVTVALLGAINTWWQLQLTSAEILSHSISIIRAVQGRGSGADAAASVYGGIVQHDAEQSQATPILATYPEFFAVYSGYKTPTVTVLKRIAQQQQAATAQYDQYYQAIGQLVLQATDAIKAQNWSALATAMQDQQDMMVQMQLSTPEIDWILTQCQQSPATLAAKISGSGLGDCVIGLGKTTANTWTTAFAQQHHIKLIPVHISTQGVQA